MLAFTEHAWENQHPVKCEETSVLGKARRPKELVLLMNEATHILMTAAC